jgi:MOSC domain-containing protein YiiM
MSYTPSTDQPIATLSELRTGLALPFAREQASAINKIKQAQPLWVGDCGIEGDEQADMRHHGGPFKAVHQLPPANYALIEAHFGIHAPIGSLGENLSTTPTVGNLQMLESTVCIGDIYQIGDTCQLEVVQPRRPCFKINDQLRTPKIASWLSKQGRTGWYYRVAKQGTICAGDPVYLVSRPYPFAVIERLWQLTNRDHAAESGELAKWQQVTPLHESWHTALGKLK